MTTKLLFLTAVSVAVALGPGTRGATPLSDGAATQPSGYTATQPAADTTTQPSTQPSNDAAVEAINRAVNAQAAQAAYDNAKTSEGDTAAVQGAYLRRLIELGQPQQGEALARQMIQADPHNGLAYALLADAAVIEGDVYTSLAPLAQAIVNAPREPIVQKLAGRILAWYDNRAALDRVSPPQQKELFNARRMIAGQGIYESSYEHMASVYQPPIPKPSGVPAQQSAPIVVFSYPYPPAPYGSLYNDQGNPPSPYTNYYSRYNNPYYGYGSFPTYRPPLEDRAWYMGHRR